MRPKRYPYSGKKRVHLCKGRPKVGAKFLKKY
nr:MAG TPA: hypothetical protein [Caudoviricetes sp.]